MDILITNFGISIHGLEYENNVLMRELILKHGFMVVSVLKIATSFLIVLGILILFDKFQNKRKYLIYFSVFLSLIPLYGIFSSLNLILLK